MTLDINEIQQILPHRPPMLLVDRIIELVHQNMKQIQSRVA